MIILHLSTVWFGVLTVPYLVCWPNMIAPFYLKMFFVIFWGFFFLWNCSSGARTRVGYASHDLSYWAKNISYKRKFSNIELSIIIIIIFVDTRQCTSMKDIENEVGILLVLISHSYFRYCILQEHCAHIFLPWWQWCTKPSRGLCHNQSTGSPLIFFCFDFFFPVNISSVQSSL